jgi:leader peptidase (prepilin peptidase)/N-methyltransferase
MITIDQLYPFLTALAFIWGTCIGSYLNVCIYRIPRELSTVKPRSHCPHCKKRIPWHWNIPLLSYLLLRGKCRFCKGSIAARYVLVELLVGVLFLLAWLKLDPAALSGTVLMPDPRPLGLVPIASPALVPVYWLMIGGLILGTFVDFEHMIIPDRVTLGGIAAGLVLSVAVPALHGQTEILPSLLRSAIGAAVGWGLLWGVATLGTLAFKKEAMGFGDVKLLGAIGAFLGWQSILFTILVSSLAGSVIGITLVVMKKREMQGRIPFGPYLALAALIWVYWGPTLWQAYLTLFAREPAV